MECRCYRGDKNRTKLVKLSYKLRDYLSLLVGALFIGGIITLGLIDSYLSAEFLSGIVGKITFYEI
jgi:hypothetical protein